MPLLRCGRRLWAFQRANRGGVRELSWSLPYSDVPLAATEGKTQVWPSQWTLIWKISRGFLWGQARGVNGNLQREVLIQNICRDRSKSRKRAVGWWSTKRAGRGHAAERKWQWSGGRRKEIQKGTLRQENPGLSKSHLGKSEKRGSFFESASFYTII